MYGEKYLPRKFKIGIAVPPSNDIDVFSQDIGLLQKMMNSLDLMWLLVVAWV